MDQMCNCMLNIPLFRALRLGPKANRGRRCSAKCHPWNPGILRNPYSRLKSWTRRLQGLTAKCLQYIRQASNILPGASMMSKGRLKDWKKRDIYCDILWWCAKFIRIVIIESLLLALNNFLRLSIMILQYGDVLMQWQLHWKEKQHTIMLMSMQLVFVSLHSSCPSAMVKNLKVSSCSCRSLSNAIPCGSRCVKKRCVERAYCVSCGQLGNSQNLAILDMVILVVSPWTVWEAFMSHKAARWQHNIMTCKVQFLSAFRTTRWQAWWTSNENQMNKKHAKHWKPLSIWIWGCRPCMHWLLIWFSSKLHKMAMTQLIPELRQWCNAWIWVKKLSSSPKQGCQLSGSI